MRLLSDGDHGSPSLVFLTAIYVCNDCALYTYCWKHFCLFFFAAVEEEPIAEERAGTYGSLDNYALYRPPINPNTKKRTPKESFEIEVELYHDNNK